MIYAFKAFFYAAFALLLPSTQHLETIYPQHILFVISLSDFYLVSFHAEAGSWDKSELEFKAKPKKGELPLES